MSRVEQPDITLADFYAGLEMVDEGMRQHILDHVHNAAMMRVLRAAERAAKPAEPMVEVGMMDKDWS